MDDQSDGQFGHFDRPGHFLRHFRFSGGQHFKSKKSWEVSCKILIQVWVGGGAFFGVLDVKNRGHPGGLWGKKYVKIYRSDLFLNFDAGIVVSRGDHFEDFVFWWVNILKD